VTPRPEIDHPRMKLSPARNVQPAYVKACCVHGAVVNEPHKDQLAQTRLSHLSSTVTLPSLVGIYNPFQEELFCYQSFCIKPLWAELWYNKPFYCSVVGSAVGSLSCSTKNRCGSNYSTTNGCGIGRCGPSFSTTNRCSSNCSTTKRCGIGRCGPSFSTTNRCSSNCSTTKRCGISRCGSSCGGTKLGPSYCKKRQTGAQCLKEGPVLGPISRGWFWSLWPYFGAPVMPFANQTRTVNPDPGVVKAVGNARHHAPKVPHFISHGYSVCSPLRLYK
jgi:hypothetical protein